MRLRKEALIAFAFALVTLRASAEPASAGGIVPPARVDETPMPYPEGASGDAVVVLELDIERDGRVGGATVKEGDPPFAEAARREAANWRFTPATRNGLPIRARVLAKVTFQPLAPPPASPEDAALPASTEGPAAVTPIEATKPAPAVPLEVTVVGEGREELGSTHVPRNEIRLIPGAFADPFRVVEVMPGVAPLISSLPYFTVRGAPPGDVGYSIDGIRVPLLFHVGAGPSVIAPALVDRVDLFPSVYPARFGRNAGGIMAGETAAPSAVGRGEAQARVFDAGAMIEQPFAGGRGSALAGGRYGYTGALLHFVAPDYALNYWDYQGRVAYRISEHDRLTAFAFGAYDFLRNEAIGRTLFEVEFHRLDLRWDRETENGRIRVATTLSSDHTLNAAENATDPGSGTTNRGIRVRVQADQRVASGLRARAGGDIGFDHFTGDREVQGPNFVPFGAHDDVYGGAWVDLVARPSGGVEIVPAFRFDAFRVRNETVLAPEPRLATRLRLADGLSWISAAGLTHQVPTFSIPIPGSNVSRFEAAKQEAWQISQAIEVALPMRVLAKGTAFRNVIFLSDATGTAHNYGFEVFLRRDFTERLGGFVSYTLSRADRVVGSASGLSTFDRPHTLSVVLGYDLGKGFRAGGRFYTQSGRPYDVACSTPACTDPPPPMTSNPFIASGRFPMFSRLDVRFEKKWRLDSGAWIALTLEWFNALLAREVDMAVRTPQGIAFQSRNPLTLPSIGIEAGY